MNNIRERKSSICYVKPRVIYVDVKGKLEQIEIGSQCTPEDIQDVFRSICGGNRRDIIKVSSYKGVVVSLQPDSFETNTPREPYKVELISCCPQLYNTILSQGARKSLQDLDNRIRKLECSMQRCVCSDAKEGVISQVKMLEERVSRIQQKQLQYNGDLLFSTKIRDQSEIKSHCSQCVYYKNRTHLSQSVHMKDMAITTSSSRSPFIPKQLTSQTTSINESSHHSKPSPDTKTPSDVAGVGETHNYEPKCDWSRISKTHEQVHAVWIQFQSLRLNEPSWMLRESLKDPQFNMWRFSDAELLWLVRHMFINLGLCGGTNNGPDRGFNRVPQVTLDLWLIAIYQHYNCVPFHNFTHAFCVVQMLYSVIHLTNLPNLVDDLDVIILMFSALSHDLDHPGLNNTFQVNAKTTLATKYNDQSPLENHHCAMAFQLIENQDRNIFKYLNDKQLKRVREMTIKCILGTDMVKHSEIVNQFKAIIPTFDVRNNIDHRNLLMVVILKVCDISNEARPAHVSEPWVESLLEEFFQQSDLEKKRGLPWAPFMDRDKATKSNSQCGFIKFVILPLFDLLGDLFPNVQDKLVNQVKAQLQYYSNLQDPQRQTSPCPPPKSPQPESSSCLIASGNIRVRRKFSLGSCQTYLCAPPPTNMPYRMMGGMGPGSQTCGFSLLQPQTQLPTSTRPRRKSSAGCLMRCSEEMTVLGDLVAPAEIEQVDQAFSEQPYQPMSASNNRVRGRKSSADCLINPSRGSQQFLQPWATQTPAPFQIYALSKSGRESTTSLPSRKSSTGSLVAASG